MDQAFRLGRIRKTGESVSTEIAYGITSLKRSKAEASALLDFTRNHRHIENGLHWVRAVRTGEDVSRIRKDSGLQFLATVRNAALHLT